MAAANHRTRAGHVLLMTWNAGADQESNDDWLPPIHISWFRIQHRTSLV